MLTGLFRIVAIFQSTPSVWRETYKLVRLSISHNVFQSTPSVWRETNSSAFLYVALSFQSTPSVWRETRRRVMAAGETYISIHSLRMEGDKSHSPIRSCSDISIHSLRMEGDGRTHAREAFHTDISIHSLRMEGDRILCTWLFLGGSISIHSLRMEGDFRPYTH